MSTDANVTKFISELEGMKDYVRVHDTPRLPRMNQLPPKTFLTAAGILLGSLFVRFGVLAFVKYRTLAKATTLQHLIQGNRSEGVLRRVVGSEGVLVGSFPTLTPDMSIIVRAIDDKGHLKLGSERMSSTDDIPDERTQEIWEILGQTIASSQSELHPVFIPHTRGSVSFITMKLPPPTTELMGELRSALQKSHFIPVHTPKRGPLKSLSFLKLNSSIVNGQLHPELVISALI